MVKICQSTISGSTQHQDGSLVNYFCRRMRSLFRELKATKSVDLSFAFDFQHVRFLNYANALSNRKERSKKQEISSQLISF